MINLDQLKLALNLHNVRRFQTHRLQQNKSVAEHSFRVGALYNYLGGTEYESAFFHDIEESITGDIPSPAKKHLKGLEYFEEMRPKYEDTKQARLGKLCDKLELVLDLREQLEDTGKLPKRLMQVYEDELEAVHDIAKELGKAKEVKQLLRELSK
jgi:5'-deoxynucleotidase YfbR-like HD superfamily hydrolase